MELGALWGDPADPTYVVKSIFIDLTKDSDDVPSAEGQLSLQGGEHRQLSGKDQLFLYSEEIQQDLSPILHVRALVKPN